MSTTTCTIQSPPRYKYAMSESADKEERKREYNRLAQREFRRRRKEHLKNLEQGRVEHTSEQASEIERLRQENADLKREISSLKQMYGSPMSGSSMGHMSMPTFSPNQHERAYSASPSINGTMDSISGAGSPQPDMIPMRNMPMTSNVLPPSMNGFADPLPVSSLQPYSMVHPSSLRHHSSQSSHGSADYGSSQSAMGPAFQSLNLSSSSSRMPPPPIAAADELQRKSESANSNSMVMTPYNRAKARAEIMELFGPLISDPAIMQDSEKHLSTLRSMSELLPPALKPTKSQLLNPHYYGIDMLASPSLRDVLIEAGTEVATSFITSIGNCRGEIEDVGQVIIWGEDPLNELSWEFSQDILGQWGWLLGPTWVRRANFWRRQRGEPQLAEPGSAW